MNIYDNHANNQISPIIGIIDIRERVLFSVFLFSSSFLSSSLFLFPRFLSQIPS